MTEKELAIKVHDRLDYELFCWDVSTRTSPYYRCICDALWSICRFKCQIQICLPKFYLMFGDEIVHHNATPLKRKYSTFWWTDSVEGVEQRKAALKKCYNF